MQGKVRTAITVMALTDGLYRAPLSLARLALAAPALLALVRLSLQAVALLAPLAPTSPTSPTSPRLASPSTASLLRWLDPRRQLQQLARSCRIS